MLATHPKLIPGSWPTISAARISSAIRGEGCVLVELRRARRGLVAVVPDLVALVAFALALFHRFISSSKRCWAACSLFLRLCICFCKRMRAFISRNETACRAAIRRRPLFIVSQFLFFRQIGISSFASTNGAVGENPPHNNECGADELTCCFAVVTVH